MTTIRNATQALRDRLSAIDVAGGYRTDIGSHLFEGFAQHLLLRDEVDTPLLCVRPATDAPDGGNGSNIKAQREKALELVFDPYDNDLAWSDDVLFDIRTALVDMEREVERVISVSTGQAEWQPIENSPLLRLLVPVLITYTDTYGVAS